MLKLRGLQLSHLLVEDREALHKERDLSESSEHPMEQGHVDVRSGGRAWLHINSTSGVTASLMRDNHGVLDGGRKDAALVQPLTCHFQTWLFEFRLPTTHMNMRLKKQTDMK